MHLIFQLSNFTGRETVGKDIKQRFGHLSQIRTYEKKKTFHEIYNSIVIMSIDPKYILRYTSSTQKFDHNIRDL